MRATASGSACSCRDAAFCVSTPVREGSSLKPLKSRRSSMPWSVRVGAGVQARRSTQLVRSASEFAERESWSPGIPAGLPDRACRDRGHPALATENPDGCSVLCSSRRGHPARSASEDERVDRGQFRGVVRRDGKRHAARSGVEAGGGFRMIRDPRGQTGLGGPIRHARPGCDTACPLRRDG